MMDRRNQNSPRSPNTNQERDQQDRKRKNEKFSFHQRSLVRCKRKQSHPSPPTNLARGKGFAIDSFTPKDDEVTVFSSLTNRRTISLRTPVLRDQCPTLVVAPTPTDLQ